MGKNPHLFGNLAELFDHEHADPGGREPAPSGVEKPEGERRDPRSIGAALRQADADKRAALEADRSSQESSQDAGQDLSRAIGDVVPPRNMHDRTVQDREIAAFEAELLEPDPRDAVDQSVSASQPVPVGEVSDAPGAQSLQAQLKTRVGDWDKEPSPPKGPETPIAPAQDAPSDGAEPGDAAKAAKPKKSHKDLLWRLVKTLVAVGAVIALGWAPLQRYWQTTSAEATVNARLVTLRAPIAGKVTIPANAASVGVPIVAGTPLLEIDNPRVDRTMMDMLRRDISGLESERDALQRRKEQLDGLLVKLEAQRDAFQAGRIKQLEARAAALTAEIAAATAKEDESRSALERATSLIADGWQTGAAHDKAKREHKVAVNTAESLRHDLAATKIELDAAKIGLFVGDSYNDIPRSAQRYNEVAEDVIKIEADIDQKTQRIAQLKDEYAQEQERFAVRSTAELTAPAPGRIWEVLTSDGEQVSHGQDLMRVLDCSGVVVTAAVSEAVFNDLRLGQPATFRLRGDTKEYAGRVTGLHGLATVPANLAIEQKVLAREPYHVNVKVPNLASGSDCHVGRTGKVTFDTSASTGAAVAAR